MDPMQQKPVHLSLCFNDSNVLVFQYFVCPPISLMTDSILFGMEGTSVAQISVLPFFREIFEAAPEECIALPFSLKYSKGALWDSSQATLGQARSFFSFFRNSCVILAVRFSLLPSFWRLGVILSDSILVNPQAFLVPSLNVISPTPFALM